MSNKKEQIFQAVMDLFKSEGVLKNLTVSEIASYADIGKGTVYEYFKSKDEVIGETIIYMLEENKKRVLSNFDDHLTFKEMMLTHINIINEILNENSSFQLMLMSDEFKNFMNDEIKHKLMSTIVDQRKQYYSFLTKMIVKGSNELKLIPITDHFTIVAIGNIIFTSILYNIHENQIKLETNELIEKIYGLILKLMH